MVITDGNAAAYATRSWSGLDGLAQIDLNRIYATTWRTPTGEDDREAKRILQAEVLVPQAIPPRFIEGFLAPSSAICQRAQRAEPQWPGEIDQKLFFED